MGLVARDTSGRIKGYLIRSHAGDAVRIGPFVAETPELARLLLSRTLQVEDEAAVEVIVPNKGPAHGLLKEFGFKGRIDRLRMELGDDSERISSLEHYATTPYLAT